MKWCGRLTCDPRMIGDFVVVDGVPHGTGASGLLRSDTLRPNGRWLRLIRGTAGLRREDLSGRGGTRTTAVSRDREGAVVVSANDAKTGGPVRGHSEDGAWNRGDG